MGQGPAIEETDRQTNSLDPPTDRQSDDCYKFEEKNCFISKRIPSVDGVYIEGKVNGFDVHITTYTGASNTLLSYKVYEQLKEFNRPKLQGKSRLRGANGNTIHVYGKGTFELQLGSLILKKNLLVADIQDEVLLGVDILQNSGIGQTDILLSKGLIRFKSHDIPCIQLGVHRDITLRCVERCDIPGNTEVIIPVFVQRECEVDDDEDIMFEPSGYLM